LKNLINKYCFYFFILYKYYLPRLSYIEEYILKYLAAEVKT